MISQRNFHDPSDTLPIPKNGSKSFSSVLVMFIMQAATAQEFASQVDAKCFLYQWDMAAVIVYERTLCLELIAITLFFTLTLGSFDADFLVVLFQGGKIFACFRELTLLHSLANIPVHERTLGIHKIELVIDAREHLGNGCGVADHAHCAHNFGKITTRDHGWWLVIDAAFKPGWAPIDKLNGTLGLDGCHCSIHILGHHITTVHHAASHVLAMTRIALCHHCCWLEAGVCDLSYRQLLVVRLLCRDDWSAH